MPNSPSSGAIDQQMRDLLVRVDQKVSDGFANITTQIAAIDTRVNGQDARIVVLEAGAITMAATIPQAVANAKRIDGLEDWKITVESSTRSYLSAGKIAWGILVFVVGFVGSQILNVTVVKHPPVEVKNEKMEPQPTGTVVVQQKNTP